MTHLNHDDLMMIFTRVLDPYKKTSLYIPTMINRSEIKRQGKTVKTQLSDQSRLATGALNTAIHENPRTKKRVKKALTKIQNNITADQQQRINDLDSAYNNRVNQLRSDVMSGVISNDAGEQLFQEANSIREQEYNKIMGGALGTVLTSLLPHIPAIADLAIKGVKGITNWIRKRKEGGVINPKYRIKGVKYASNVPVELKKMLTGGLIKLQNTGGRLYLTSGGELDEGVRVYDLVSGDNDLDITEDEEVGSGVRWDLNRLTDNEYYGTGLKQLSKIKYMIDGYKRGHGIDRQQLSKTYGKLMKILKKR
jgi:hypothetical protein